MGKKTHKKKGIHRFYLKSIGQSGYFKKQIYVDFCFRKNNQNCCCTHEEGNSNYVIFNKDKNYATPSFILNFDQQYYFNFFETLKRQHDQRLMNMDIMQQKIEFPNPQSQKKKCHVCNCIYNDYIEHIHSELHKKKITQSPFNDDILQLEKAFRKSKNLKEKQITKKNQNTTYSQQCQNSLQSSSNSIKQSKSLQEQDKSKIDPQQKEQINSHSSEEISEEQVNLHNINIFQTSQFNNQVVNIQHQLYKGSLQHQSIVRYCKFQQDLLANPFFTNIQKYQLLQYLTLQNIKMTNYWIKYYQSYASHIAINKENNCQKVQPQKSYQTNNTNPKLNQNKEDLNKIAIQKDEKIGQNQICQKQDQIQKLKELVEKMKDKNKIIRKLNEKIQKKINRKKTTKNKSNRKQAQIIK